MNKYFLTAIILTIGSNIMAQENDLKIPAGVVYKKTSEEINLKAKELLQRELTKPEYIFFDKYLYCGPNIWNRYASLPKTSTIKKGNIKFEIPQSDGSVIYGDGKFIQSKNDFITVWNQIIVDFNNSDIHIRKLNSNELQYFWHILFYDIEEPLYIVEANKHKIIFDISVDFKVTFIEETFD